MSQLFDSLRRASRASRNPQPQPTIRPRRDIVFETLGSARVQRGEFVARAAALLGAVAILSALVWFGLQRSPPPDAGPATSSPAITSPPKAPPPAVPPVERPAEDRAGHPIAARPVDKPPEPAIVEPAAGMPERPARADVRPAGYRTSQRPLESSSSTPFEEFRHAVEYQRAGDLDAAVRIYQALLGRGQLTAEVHNNLGLLFHSRGMAEDAISEFQLAIAARAGYTAAHNNLGVALLSLKRVVEAEASFRRAAELDGRDADAVINLALAQKAGGRFERARESLLRALALAPRSAPAHYNLAVLYEKSGERGRAVEHYQAFLEYAGPEHREHIGAVQSRLAALNRMR